MTGVFGNALGDRCVLGTAACRGDVAVATSGGSAVPCWASADARGDLGLLNAGSAIVRAGMP